MTLRLWQVVVISHKWCIEVRGLGVSASLNTHYKF